MSDDTSRFDPSASVKTKKETPQPSWRDRAQAVVRLLGTDASRGVAQSVLCLAGLGLFAVIVHKYYPLEEWLFWPYAGMWLLTLAWMAACVSAGDFVLRRLGPWRFPLSEHLTMSLAVGLLVFCSGLFLVGLLGALGTPFFVVWPTAMLAVGGPGLVRRVHRFFRRTSRARRLARTARRSVWQNAWSPFVFGFGLLGVLLVYVNIITPANAAYDARWYHLGIAEHYVATGRIEAFTDGWFIGAYPHMASLIYTWGFLVPGSLFFRTELCAHMEFGLFLATLAGIPALVRWMLGGRRAPLAWVSLFLFPMIFLYDSSLSIGADHIVAFWAVPIFLALRRSLRDLTGRNCGLLGAVLAGPALTKYQGVYLVAFPILAVGAKALVDLFFLLRRKATWQASVKLLTGPAWMIGVFLLVTASHWLKNWVYYGDPIYPMAASWFSPHPLEPDADPDIVHNMSWVPQGPFVDKLRDTLGSLVTFSFIPHDWPTFHGDRPAFGSLFTLLGPVLLVTRRSGRALTLLVATLLGVGIWYYTYHEDRFLQALVPWMAAVVAATIALVWRSRWPVKMALGLLIAFQVVWGGDIPFFATHAMAGQPPIKTVVDMIGAGYKGEYKERFDPHSEFVAVSKLLPQGSKVLVHEQHTHLGIREPSVSDSPGTQGAISYARLGTARAVYDKLKQIGVTHVAWRDPRGWQRFSDDVVFYDFARQHLAVRGSASGYRVGELVPSREPSSTGPAWETPSVAVSRCGRAKTVPLSALDRTISESTSTWPPESSLRPEGARYFVYQRDCGSGSSPPPQPPFVQVAHRDAYDLFARVFPGSSNTH